MRRLNGALHLGKNLSELNDLPHRVGVLLKELKIPRDLVMGRGLRLCNEAQELVVVEAGADGFEHLLIPSAAQAWHRLRNAALADGVTLNIASAFRSFDRQVEVIRRKLARGWTLEAVLMRSAPPGFSEHHLGRAVDVVTPGGARFEPEFEQTEAFRWLTERANSFGYTLSFPRGNSCGYMYEPWHWCFDGTKV